MRVTLFESISVNGMMGRPSGSGDFFSSYCWTGFVDAAKQTGAMIWGRVTHEAFRGMPGAVEQLAGVKGVVLTSRRDYVPGPGWQIAGTPREALEVLSKTRTEGTLVVGGQTVNTAFLREGLLDEIILLVESVVIGRGMPVFAASDADLRLSLLDVTRPTDTVLRLRYRVLK